MKFIGTIIAGAILALFGYFLNQKAPELVTCPPVPSNIVTEFKLDSICRFAFI